MLSRRIVLPLLALAPAACSAPAITTALTAAGEASGILTPTGAVSFYSIIKGIAEVAVVADPGLSTIVSAAIAAGDALAADAASASSTSQASAQKLVTASAALATQTAQAIKVIPSSASPSPAP